MARPTPDEPEERTFHTSENCLPCQREGSGAMRRGSAGRDGPIAVKLYLHGQIPAMVLWSSGPKQKQEQKEPRPCVSDW